jgi:hypothetical protein
MEEAQKVTADREARVVLGLFCALLFVVAALVRSHGASGIDVRTYIEMVAGVARNGLPYLDNGPVDRYPLLQVPWNVASGGHLWGMYGPTYPYFAAPFLRLGGLPLVSVATFALLVPTALATFALARQLTRSERLATAAAILSVVSTPILAKAVEPSAYPLAVLLVTVATWMALVATSHPHRQRLVWAFASGTAGGLAVGAHLLCFPMVVALLLALFVVDTTDAEPPASFFRSLVPTARKLTTAATFAVGLALCIVPLAWLNRVRFHSYNPFSYGPAPWRWGHGIGTDTLHDQLAFALPTFGFLALIGVALFAMRRSKVAMVGVLATTIIALVVSAKLRHDLFAMVGVAWGVLIEISLLGMDMYTPSPGTFGAILNKTVVKSMLQATPLLVMVCFARGLVPRARHGLLLIIAPCAALLGYMLLRASLSPLQALGFPFANIRYTLPALPLLMSGAMLAARELPLTRKHWLWTAGLGTAAAIVLCLNDDDRWLWRQAFILLLPLATAVVAAVSMIRLARGRSTASRVAWCLVPAMAMGIALGIGHDMRSSLAIQSGCNARIDYFASLVPRRLAIVGGLGPIDGVLPLRATHDLEYTDMSQYEYPSQARPLLEHWFAEDRPMFFVVPGDPVPESPWPDLALEPLGPSHTGFYRITRR